MLSTLAIALYLRGEEMNCKFIGKAEITNISNNKFKRIMLTVGIICLLFAMVVEFVIGNKGACFFIIPLIYLFGLRNQIVRKKIILDVPMSVTINESDVEIIFYNTIRNKPGAFSEKYYFDVAEVEKCNYLKKYREIQILTNSQYYKIGDSSVKKEKTKIRNIRFKLAKEVEYELLNELEKKITIDYFD